MNTKKCVHLPVCESHKSCGGCMTNCPNYKPTHMDKAQFCSCLIALRNYGDWERKMYECGLDMASTPVTAVLDLFQGAMCGFDYEWAYDDKIGMNWIIEWCYSTANRWVETRHGREFDVTEAPGLYDFLVFMNEHGWED